MRRAISAQWVFEMGLLAVASWGDRLKRRGNGLQNRLALVKSSLEDLHAPRLRVVFGSGPVAVVIPSAIFSPFSESQLRGLASFRRLAFEEIHSAGWWGRTGHRLGRLSAETLLLSFLCQVRLGLFQRAHGPDRGPAGAVLGPRSARSLS